MERLSSLPVPDALPHHFQYQHHRNSVHSSMVLSSPMTAAASCPIPKSKTSELSGTEATFPKITLICPSNSDSTDSPTPPALDSMQNAESTTFTVMVRACHSVLQRSGSTNDGVTLHSFLEAELPNAAVSVFSQVCR